MFTIYRVTFTSSGRRRRLQLLKECPSLESARAFTATVPIPDRASGLVIQYPRPPAAASLAVGVSS